MLLIFHIELYVINVLCSSKKNLGIAHKKLQVFENVCQVGAVTLESTEAFPKNIVFLFMVKDKKVDEKGIVSSVTMGLYVCKLICDPFCRSQMVSLPQGMSQMH